MPRITYSRYSASADPDDLRREGFETMEKLKMHGIRKAVKLPDDHPVSMKVAETKPGAPHDFRAIDEMSEGLAIAYAKMVHGPLMADIRRWARRLSRDVKKSLPRV